MGQRATKILPDNDKSCRGCCEKLTVYHYNDDGLKITLYNKKFRVIGCMFFKNADSYSLKGKCPSCRTRYYVKLPKKITLTESVEPAGSTESVDN